jgi:hypothetical protein
VRHGTYVLVCYVIALLALLALLALPTRTVIGVAVGDVKVIGVAVAVAIAIAIAIAVLWTIHYLRRA